MRVARRMIFPLAVSTFVVSCSIGDEPGDSFDTPISTVSVDLGPSPYVQDPDIRRTLQCYYYPQVMIKEYSAGGFGAQGLSMLSRPQELPECELSPQRGERVIDTSEWEGWFKGVKDALVFFGPPDDFNGHSPFAIFDSVSGEKIFEDSAYGKRMPSSDYWTSRMRVISTEEGYVLRYMRVVDADCNLNLEGGPCWERIKTLFALQIDEVPACMGYDRIANLVGTDDVESVIAYPVEVSLTSPPTIKAGAGAAKCWAAQ